MLMYNPCAFTTLKETSMSMLARLFLAMTILFGLSSTSLADDQDQKVWYEKGFEGTVPTTLKVAIEADRAYLGVYSTFWKPVYGPGTKKVCNALKAVGVTYDYNTRYAITTFLAFYGKSVFPASGGTNSCCTEADPNSKMPDNVFSGTLHQNNLLAASIKRNAALFKEGDLTADDVKNRWR